MPPRNRLRTLIELLGSAAGLYRIAVADRPAFVQAAPPGRGMSAALRRDPSALLAREENWIKRDLLLQGEGSAREFGSLCEWEKQAFRDEQHPARRLRAAIAAAPTRQPFVDSLAE